MGLTPSFVNFIESSIASVFEEDRQPLRMLELGNQHLRLSRASGTTQKTGKEYFSERGFTHISIDLNGLDGALIRDLREPQQFLDLQSSIDVVTNVGTTEHIEPKEYQYECFGIIHRCMKTGGLSVHIVPDVVEHDEHGRYRNHCRYFYSQSFFELLAQECAYELINSTVIEGCRCVALKKTEDRPFMTDRVKLLGEIAEREYGFYPLGSLRQWLGQVGVGDFLRKIGLRKPKELDVF